MTRFALALAVSLIVGCGHAHTVAPTEPTETKTEGGSAPVWHPARVTSNLKGPNGEPQNISIATSPSLLLKPGAAKAIQVKLSHDGDLHGDVGSDLDGATRDALARFQRRHDLPATGIPDDATVRKLGLKPEDVFRSGNDKSHE